MADKTFVQLNTAQLLWKYEEESISIAIIVNHMGGNMLSRWTDLLTTDGEKSWRSRDAEFDDTLTSKEELLERWEVGSKCLFTALNSLKETDLEKEIFIRIQGHTVVEAINRQLAHYAYHVE